MHDTTAHPETEDDHTPADAEVVHTDDEEN